MYLKKLDLIGFKSFADPTTITFQPGITAIVGPNGCGKSNIVDAILWVLGEQSTKTLRSERMEDVIFNGSDSRKPINMAEVVLTVGGVTPEQVGNQYGEFQELSLGRRLFRSGESEYMINKMPCRLRDIRDLLIDTGAGHKGHTIIEQGKVDQLLNASPQERRDLIEETAGIAKYRIRRAEAERKLEATQQNLLRVRDIITEVKRQIQGLDRQVKKAETYQALRSEAQNLSLLLIADEFRTVHRDWEETSRLVQENRVAESAILARLSTAEAEIQNGRTGLVEEEQKLAGLRQQSFDLKTQIQRLESRLELLKSQMTAWEEQRVRLVQDQERMGNARAQAEAQADSGNRQRETLRQSILQQQQELSSREQAGRELEARITRQEEALEQDKTRFFEILGLITDAKNQMAAMESRYHEILRVQQKGRTELGTVTEQLEQNRKALESERALLIGLDRKVAEAVEKSNHLAESIREKREAAALQALQLDRQREELTLAQARLSSLQEREKGLITSKTSIQHKLSARPELFSKLHGIVADLMTVPKSYEKAIEAVLGDRLQALVSDDHATVLEVIRHLKATRSSRSVFVPKTLRMKPGAIGNITRDGVIGPALAYVEARPGFETLLQGLLGGVILVRDLETALDLWRLQPMSETLVTLEGDIVFPSGMVAGGHPEEDPEGLLQTRRRVKELEEKVRLLSAELTHSEEARNRLAGELERMESEQEALIQEQHRSELETAAQRQKVTALESEARRLSEHLALLQGEDRQGIKESEEITARMEQIRRRLKELQGEQTELESRLAEGQEELKRLTDRRTVLASELTDLKVGLTSLMERQEVLIQEESRLIQEQAALTERIRQREAEAGDLFTRIQSARKDSSETQAMIGGLGDQLSKAESVLTQKTEQYAGHLDRLKQLEAGLSGIRGEWGRVEGALKDHEVRLAELKMKREHLAEQLASTHSTTPEEALPKLEQEPFSRDEAHTRLSELRAKIEQMGPVNLAAPEEYKELEERYRFLTTQEADLTRSIEDLQKAIQKISRTTREMFVTTFQTLRVKFCEVFASFFEGGLADLILLDESNPLESGIEIMAQPPGKRLRSIALLSGGEKALTAIALLFASFLIHPSPFCVLDEIDAPLDEENIRRFIRALRAMTDHSQFLIITHNKRTMEQADILYGVTMEEPGVSKLVSVKLESVLNGGAGVRLSESGRQATVA
jgi:chromosome segregation protein